MTSSAKVPQRSGSTREGIVSSNDRKMSSNKKINKPNEPVKRIFQQFDNGPRPSDVVLDIDVTLEVENLVLNKDIGVQTDEFSYVFEPSPEQNRPFDEIIFYNDNDKVRFYTGLHSFQVLMKTFHFIEPRVKKHSIHLNKFQEFIMELMKLRLDVPHLDLVYRFDVSRPVVTRVISAWLVIMDVRLSPLISWSTCDALHKTMPQRFVDSFGYETTVTIDCFEIFIDRPTNLMARAQTFSNYKHHNTVKVLIAISPRADFICQ